MLLQYACRKDASFLHRYSMQRHSTLLLYGILGLKDKLCGYVQDNNQ